MQGAQSIVSLPEYIRSASHVSSAWKRDKSVKRDQGNTESLFVNVSVLTMCFPTSEVVKGASPSGLTGNTMPNVPEEMSPSYPISVGQLRLTSQQAVVVPATYELGWRRERTGQIGCSASPLLFVHFNVTTRSKSMGNG